MSCILQSVRTIQLEMEQLQEVRIWVKESNGTFREQINFLFASDVTRLDMQSLYLGCHH